MHLSVSVRVCVCVCIHTYTPQISYFSDSSPLDLPSLGSSPFQRVIFKQKLFMGEYWVNSHSNKKKDKASHLGHPNGL